MMSFCVVVAIPVTLSDLKVIQVVHLLRFQMRFFVGPTPAQQLTRSQLT